MALFHGITVQGKSLATFDISRPDEASSHERLCEPIPAVQDAHVARLIQGSRIQDLEGAVRAYAGPFPAAVHVYTAGQRVFRHAPGTKRTKQVAFVEPPPLKRARQGSHSASVQVTVATLGDEDASETKEGVVTLVPVTDLLRGCQSYLEIDDALQDIKRLGGRVVLYATQREFYEIDANIVPVENMLVSGHIRTLPRTRPQHERVRDLIEYIMRSHTPLHDCIVIGSEQCVDVDGTWFVNHLFGRVAHRPPKAHTLCIHMPPGRRLVHAAVLKPVNNINVDASHSHYVTIRTTGGVDRTTLAVITEPTKKSAADEDASLHWKRACQHDDVQVLEQDAISVLIDDFTDACAATRRTMDSGEQHAPTWNTLTQTSGGFLRHSKSEMKRARADGDEVDWRIPFTAKVVKTHAWPLVTQSVGVHTPLPPANSRSRSHAEFS